MLYYLSIFHAISYCIITIIIALYQKIPDTFQYNYFLIDHLSIYEIAIVSIIFLCAALYAKGYIENLIRHNELDKKNIKLFYISFNLLLIVTAFTFLANNLGIFWIFAELTTIFSVVLIATLNAKENIDAALKYLFITSSAMLFSLIGLILMYAATETAIGHGTLNWTELMNIAASLSPQILGIAFIFIFIGFAAKSGIAPMHTWLPHAHAKAPSVISAILSGVLLNVGIYGIIRIFAVVHHANVSTNLSYFLIFFGIITLIISAFSMLRQNNLKKLIAFSSIENMGILLIAIGLWTKTSLFWALFFILAHALIKSMLFLTVGIINRQYHSNDIEMIKNLFALQPFLSVILILGTIAIIGIPPFAMFITKLSILAELALVSKVVLVIALIGITIAGFAMIKSLASLFIENTTAAIRLEQYRVPTSIKISLLILLILIIVVSIFGPQMLSGWLNTIVSELGVSI